MEGSAFRRGMSRKAAARNGRQRLPQGHVQEGGGQGAGPGAGAGQRNGHKDGQTQIFILGHHSALQVGLLLQPGDQVVQTGQVAAHPLEDAADVHDDEGHRQHVADDGRQVGKPHRQSYAHAEGDTAPQLDDGDHRHQNGEAEFAAEGVVEPMQDFHRDLVSVFAGCHR